MESEQIIKVIAEETEQDISVICEEGEREIEITPELIEITGTEPYEGSYELTPTQQTQILPTEGLRMTANVVINPIPSNYGRIGWNGLFLTVS